ncbi:MAG: pyruvate kinase [Saprospiraceae bacterium]|nr:MAG: pyruvate kinase [Saprospiraceae bacterium]
MSQLKKDMPDSKNNKGIDKVQPLIDQINHLIQLAIDKEEEHKQQLKKVHSNYQRSAKNLLHYRALRSLDLRELHQQLGDMGLSRLARAEGHVMTSLLSAKEILQAFQKEKKLQKPQQVISVKRARRLLLENTESLLGKPVEGRRTRIMVTLPSEAAKDFELVHALIEAGMNCARINCAHDDARVWEKMVQNVRTAAKKLDRECAIAMDLAGPKIRTGALVPGPQIRKYRPVKNRSGLIVSPLPVWLGPFPPKDTNLAHIPVESPLLEQLSEGDVLKFKDVRNKKRRITILEVTPEGCRASCPKTTFLETGLPMFRPGKVQLGPFYVAPLPAVEQPIPLIAGDKLILHKSSKAGEPAQYNRKGAKTEPAHISCTSPELFKWVKPDEPILFDDGKIEGIIQKVSEKELLIEIVQTPPGGTKLRADKGINLPKSDLHLSGLTTKDRKDLKFVCKHADVVNFSFVNSPQDVKDLLQELDELKAKDKLGIILKIETQAAFNTLTSILLEAMQVYPIGVMIARGDLAIETGWENIGRVQQEILALCHSAHLTDVWATQVLENLAKRGLPSRAEITDAVIAQRADCVMLNKGPYIIQAIRLLDTILKGMDPYRDKNVPMLPTMQLAGE